MSQKNSPDKIQKGIQIEATKSQILSAMFLIFVMLFLPIFFLNRIDNRSKQTQLEVYTASAVTSNTTTKETGRVAGIYDDKTQKTNEVLSFAKFLLTSSTFFIGLGITMFIIFTILTLSLFVDFAF